LSEINGISAFKGVMDLGSELGAYMTNIDGLWDSEFNGRIGKLIIKSIIARIKCLQTNRK